MHEPQNGALVMLPKIVEWFKLLLSNWQEMSSLYKPMYGILLFQLKAVSWSVVCKVQQQTTVAVIAKYVLDFKEDTTAGAVAITASVWR